MINKKYTITKSLSINKIKELSKYISFKELIWEYIEIPTSSKHVKINNINNILIY